MRLVDVVLQRWRIDRRVRVAISCCRARRQVYGTCLAMDVGRMCSEAISDGGDDRRSWSSHLGHGGVGRGTVEPSQARQVALRLVDPL